MKLPIRMPGWVLLLHLLFPLLPGAALAVPPQPFSVGERLEYTMTWFGINVGTGTLEIEDREDYKGREAYRIISTAQSNKYLAWLFPVQDRIESLVDANDIFSYKIDVNQHHGMRRVRKQIVFDQEKKEAIMTFKGKERIYPIPEKVQDSLSCLYYFRTVKDLSVGNPVYIDVHESKKNWRLEIDVLGRERVTVPMGTYDTVKVVAKVQYEGVLLDKGDVFLWLTDDIRKVPVLIAGKVSIGPFTASLVSGAIPGLNPAPGIDSGHKERATP
jgi:Protein of unknown function (DUF3108)